MKTLACKDMGIDDGFMVKGATDEEVMGKMMEHVKMAHADKMAGTSEEDMKKMMMEKIMDDGM
jgi:predicted small metal-binding protein